MNTPRSKPIVRHTGSIKLPKKPPKMLQGNYTGGLHNPDIASYVGSLITYLPHIEERMITIMSLLMGGNAPARQVFRSLTSEEARIKVMRSLLERAPINQDKDKAFDEVIDLFVEVKNKRNAYAHGLWWTHDETKRTFIEEPTTSEGFGFFSRREVKLNELKATTKRMNDLIRKANSIIYPDVASMKATMEALLKTLPKQPVEEIP